MLTRFAYLFVPLAGVLAGCGGAPVAQAPEAGGSPTAPPASADAPVVIPLDEVKASQSASVWQQVATTDITITYDRPVARGRELFGGIVAYGEIWNPGANDATKIEITQPIRINGETLAAGAYSIWAIPDPDEWTVIFNRQADVYHTPYPGEDHDALRLSVAPQTGDHVETLAFYFETVERKDAVLRLHWGETIVPFLISVP